MFLTPSIQHFQLAKSFSLLILGIALATLATLNFSLAFLVGLLASPLTFVQPCPQRFRKLFVAALLAAIAPPVICILTARILHLPLTELLRESSFGWNVRAIYTPIVIWCIWWPAWLVAMINVLATVID